MTYTYAATVNPGEAIILSRLLILLVVIIVVDLILWKLHESFPKDENPFNDPCLLFMGIITMSFIGIVIGLTIGTGGNFVWKPL